MAENDGGGSEDEVQSETEPALETEAPAYPFDAGKHDLVIDFRATCSIPFDPESDGVKSLRAIMFGKGKGIHAPSEAGKLYVVGDWKLLTSLLKVHFVSSTHRQPELLLAFVDYGFANSVMSGVSVETLSLPLLVKNGVYQTATKVTRIEDVSGFSPIPLSSAPWSITLKPTLAKKDFFKKNSIFAPADINKWLSSQTMLQRVQSLEKRTRVEMEAEIKDLGRQDPSQATKIKAVFEAKLKTLMDSIAKLPPSAYDVRMGTRVCQLVEGRDVEKDPLWLTSPLQQSMQGGNAKFARTRLVAAAAAAPPVREPVEPVPVDITGAGAPEAAGMADLELSDDEDEAEEGDNDSELDILEPRDKSQRQRKAPKRLDPTAPAGEKSAKVPKKKAENIRAPATNSANGKDYRRGPYKKAPQTAAAALAKAERAALKKELKTADSKAEVAALKLQLKAALEGKKVAEEKLRDQNQMTVLQIEKAKAEGEKIGLKAAGEEYKKGIAAGAAIAMGKSFHFENSSSPGGPPSSAASGSRSSSNPFAM